MKKKNIKFGKVNLPGVVMTNSGTSGFTESLISAAALNAMECYLAPLAAFSTAFGSEIAEDGDSLKVEVVNGVGDAQESLTDWAISDLNLGSRDVTLVRLSRPMSLTYAERKNGVRLANKIDGLVKAISNKAFAKIVDLFKDSTAINSLELDGAAAFSPTIMTDHVWASIVGGADVALLRQEYFARLVPKDANGLKLEGGSYQMKDGVHNVLGVEDLKATKKGVGIASKKSGLCVATKLPNIPEGMGIRVETITSDKLGISMALKFWGNADKEIQYVSAELMFGCSIGIGAHVTKLVQKDSVTSSDIPGLTKAVEPTTSTTTDSSSGTTTTDSSSSATTEGGDS